MAILNNKKFFSYFFSLFFLLYFLPSTSYSASLEQIKMAFVFNLSNYVTWPESSFENEQSPFVICLDANSDTVDLLNLTVKGENIKGRDIKVINTSMLQFIEQCHIAYISSSKYTTMPLLSKNIAPVSLLVSDIDNFAEKGGMIELKEQDQRLKLLINLTSVKKNGLTIRSNLLNLSIIVN